ncbi:fibrinogen alpha chain-like [Alosa alosa]|uniref:fibrinogen alpha chain-like n=1 Tax=Alosa alosa TaxID=278164 RepID=UPI0020151CCD|nr:fibrinogen alpha chain-like [Alosa alosa]
MKLQQVLCLCMLLVAAWATEFEDIGGGVRGNRPVEHGYKASDTCKTEKDWPMCTDGDWGPKCPSGCRIQGLLDKTDHNLLTRIDKIRQLLDQYRQKYRSTDQSSKQTYDYLRDRLTTSSGDDNKYMSLAESLRKRIVEVKIKIERQLRILEALKTRVREQVIEMQRLEVDIDMKLRSCKGSCAEYAKFTADRESYVAIDKQLDQLESIRVNSVESVGSLRVMKSRVLKEVTVPSIYKSGLGSEAEEQKQYFADVGQAELILQGDGGTTHRGSTSPLTASSSSHPHSSSSSSPHSSSSSFPHSSSSSIP